MARSVGPRLKVLAAVKRAPRSESHRMACRQNSRSNSAITRLRRQPGGGSCDRTRKRPRFRFVAQSARQLTRLRHLHRPRDECQPSPAVADLIGDPAGQTKPRHESPHELHGPSVRPGPRESTRSDSRSPGRLARQARTSKFAIARRPARSTSVANSCQLRMRNEPSGFGKCSAAGRFGSRQRGGMEERNEGVCGHRAWHAFRSI